MPGTAALNLINLNIDSIQTLAAECKTNKEQETHIGIEACTNTNTTRDEDSKNNNVSIDIKQDTNSHNHPGDMHISINYFYSSNNVDADKRSSITMMQRIHTRLWQCF